MRNRTKLIDELFVTDLTEKVPELPAYFFGGEHDYTVNCALSKTYLEMLKAPENKFFIFSRSAHSPMHEEPEAFMKVMAQEVLGKR